ncbi:MAG TPA: hypothetical protein VHD61_00185 [Lacunisphaera sp.]|nr:hypothetical protein [Lacunisphaera sp.]
MKTTRFALSLFCLATFAFLRAPLHAAEREDITGILISASNQRGESDRRLASYEPTLRRILRFESYRFLGEGDVSLAVPARGNIALGDGHRLEIETERSDGRAIHLRVSWEARGRTLMNTSLILRPGVPAVLGGPSTGKPGEVFAVILVGR